MTDPDAEQKAPRVGGVDAVERLGDGLGGRRPDVDDAGSHLERGRRLQKWLDEGQFSGWRTADPNCAVAEPFNFPSLVGGGAKSEVAEPAEVDCCCFRCSHCLCNPRIPRTYSAAGETPTSADLFGQVGGNVPEAIGIARVKCIGCNAA